MKEFIIFSIFISLFSCSSNNIEDEYYKLKSKRIIIPEYQSVYYNGEKISLSNIGCSKLKLLIYIDSLNCNSCYLKRIKKWDTLIEYAQKKGNKLNYYFIFSPRKKDIGMMTYLLKNTDVNCPLIIDSIGEFRKMNDHLPKNRLLQTFLVDENNHVIMIGDPTKNDETNEIFRKKVEMQLGKR